MKKKWRAKFKEELIEDAKRTIEEVNSDPTLQDVEAPKEMFENIMKQIHEMEEAKTPVVDTRLTAEEQELIRLGRVYKKRRTWNRYVVIAAAVIAMLAVGMTSIGGPKRVVEIVREFVDERERTKINTDDERVKEEVAQSENEVYLEIEEEFNCKAVSMKYLPKGVDFVESVIEKETQNARLYYEDGKGKVLSYSMYFNYRPTAAGIDVEDKLLNSYDMEMKGVVVTIKEYEVEGERGSRWRVEFFYQKVQYFMILNGFSGDEIEKVVKNLNFY